MAGRRLTVLIALGDAGRAERLSASLAASEEFAPVPAGSVSGVDVAIVDNAALQLAVPLVLLSSRPVAAVNGSAGRVFAVLPPNAEDGLIAAAARLAVAGYHAVRDEEALETVDFAAEADDHLSGDHEVAARPSLSPREAEVLALLAEGAPNKVIARRLDISVHTAKFHVAAILTKLGAANRTDAIAIAMRQGLVLV
ncbi:helix-turn-helix transcriptional regulator [Mesorhizobium sp. 1M-11]|uniref:response regulator transcription factor n=1 Tax=Mesorhizobium sp. 1M-11 TaxID=1529006 RepID=UPI0006C748C5|nr:helix-turn-helix transcriptional regulator [Mesorhizobium sp. 1M-11]